MAKKILFSVLIIAALSVFVSCDETNSDGTGGNCEHSYTVISESKADCETDGIKTEKCTLCNYIKKTETEAYGHDFEEKELLSTCKDAGGVFDVCKVCEKKVAKNTFPKLEHEFVYKTTAAGCLNEGHKITTCENCDYYEKSDVAAALGHKIGDWVVVTAATETSDGLKKRVCERCDHTEFAYITSTSYIDRTYITEEFNADTVYEIATYDELLLKFGAAVVNMASNLRCKLNYSPDFDALTESLIDDFDSPFAYTASTSLLGSDLTIEFSYQAQPTGGSGTVHYTQYSSINYKAPASSRPSDYDSFKIEKSVYSFEVSTTDQLYYALERGAKPICKSGSAAESAYTELKNILRTIIDDSMTDTEKVRAIYDYLVMNVTYDKALYDLIGSMNSEAIKAYNGFYLEGVLFDRVAVCEGISKAFTSLCNIEGIPCVTVSGYQAANPTGVGHAWNKVYADGKWYIADATSGGTIVGERAEVLTYRYFLISEETYRTHYIGENFTEIDCNHDFSFYEGDSFRYQGAEYDFIISSQSELNLLVAYFCSFSGSGITVEFKFAFDIGDSVAEELGEAYSVGGFSVDGVTYTQDGDICILIRQ